MDVQVIVQDRQCVQQNRKLFGPGKKPLIEEKEARRLAKIGVVKIIGESQQEHQAGDGPTVNERQKLLIEAIGKLDTDKSNKDHWTRSGLPQTGALAEIIGDPVSAPERSEAFELYQELKGGGA